MQGAARSAPTQPAAKLRAARGFGLSPKFALAAAGAVLLAGVAVALGTGDRAQKVVEAGQAGLTERFADLGFRLKTVHLQGATAQASADILKAADIRRDQPLFALDLDAVRQHVEHVGWVKSARVIRLLPDTLVIAVDQRQLLAVWQHAGQTQVIDSDGVGAPEADPNHFTDLPLVVGDGANVAAAAILPSVLSRPRLVQRLEALVRVDDRRWDLRLKDGSLIQLPASDEEGALIRLDQLDQRSRILELGFSRIDLRDPEMVAVRPRETQAVAQATDGVG